MTKKVIAAALLLAPIASVVAIWVRRTPAIDALNEGAAASLAGRHGAALKHYDRAIALDPKWAVAHCERGDVLVKLKRYKDAVQSLKDCQDLDPGTLEAKASLAIALLVGCDYGAAAIALDDLDQSKGTDPRMNAIAEWVRLRLKRTADLGGRCLSEREIGAL